MSDSDHSPRAFWSGRSVLITGASGFIGANLTRQLLAYQADVHIVLRQADAPWRLDDCVDRLTVHVADVSNCDQLFRTVNACRPQTIFHLATERGIADGQRMRYVQTTVLGAANLVEVLRRQSSCRLIVAGSSLEYGPCDEPISESNPLTPHTLHGAVKAAASVLFSQAAQQDNLEISQLRLFHVYGPWESGHRFLPTVIRAGLNDQSVSLAAGQSRRDWIFVLDVVGAFLLAAQPQVPIGTFNIGSGLEHSNDEVLAVVENLLARKIPRSSKLLTARLTDQAHRFANISAAKAALGWSPQYDLVTGIKCTLEWVRNFPGTRTNEQGVVPVVQ